MMLPSEMRDALDRAVKRNDYDRADELSNMLDAACEDYLDEPGFMDDMIVPVCYF
jgi:hypothetical protein